MEGHVVLPCLVNPIVTSAAGSASGFALDLPSSACAGRMKQALNATLLAVFSHSLGRHASQITQKMSIKNDTGVLQRGIVVRLCARLCCSVFDQLC